MASLPFCPTAFTTIGVGLQRDNARRVIDAFSRQRNELGLPPNGVDVGSASCPGSDAVQVSRVQGGRKRSGSSGGGSIANPFELGRAFVALFQGQTNSGSAASSS